MNTSGYVQDIGPDGPFGKDPTEIRGSEYLANNPEDDSQYRYAPTGAGSGATRFCSKGDNNPLGHHPKYLKTGAGSLRGISRITGGMEPEKKKQERLALDGDSLPH